MKLTNCEEHIPGMGSPPARGRGLKQFSEAEARRLIRSPPARGRGLKRQVIRQILQHLGRPPHGGVD